MKTNNTTNTSGPLPRGPYVIYQDNLKGVIVHDDNGDIVFIQMYPEDMNPADKFGQQMIQRARAIARLIVAAPDLLEVAVTSLAVARNARQADAQGGQLAQEYNAAIRKAAEDFTRKAEAAIAKAGKI